MNISGNCRRLGGNCDFMQRHQFGFNNNDQLPCFQWPAAMQEACQRWRSSGIPSVALIQQSASPSWHNFPLNTLRYLHYAAMLASFLGNGVGKNQGLTLYWWDEFKW
jgi:hypothetical protein